MPSTPAPEPSSWAPRSLGAPAGDTIESELHAILGEGTALTGRFSFAGRARVEGQVEGELLGGELLVIAGSARVRGSVSAERVLVLGGEVHADITAKSSIELRVPAIVTGDLRAPEIFLERGVSFTGKCTMGPAVE